MRAFAVFGQTHIAALVAVVLIGALMALAAVRIGDPWQRRSEHLLAILLFAVWPMRLIGYLNAGTLTLGDALPLHYCDVSAITGALALWTRRQVFCEIVYFFGLAGTLQGLITPPLDVDWPHPRFIYHFLWHGGVVIAAIHVVTAMRHAPRAGAILRMMGWTALYAAIVGALDALLHTNYGFLCFKPPSPSLMDHLGPWPWYVAALAGVALLLYTLLDLPFWWKRRR